MAPALTHALIAMAMQWQATGQKIWRGFVKQVWAPGHCLPARACSLSLACPELLLLSSPGPRPPCLASPFPVRCVTMEDAPLPPVIDEAALPYVDAAPLPPRRMLNGTKAVGVKVRRRRRRVGAGGYSFA